LLLLLLSSFIVTFITALPITKLFAWVFAPAPGTLLNQGRLYKTKKHTMADSAGNMLRATMRGWTRPEYFASVRTRSEWFGTRISVDPPEKMYGTQTRGSCLPYAPAAVAQSEVVLNPQRRVKATFLRSGTLHLLDQPRVKQRRVESRTGPRQTQDT
jgi:hypothetical protein